MIQTSADDYLRDGCGRCDRFRTPECKVRRWTDALVALRALLGESGLVEEMKWGSPCYTLGGKNVVLLTSFNDYCALAFFKGAALADDEGLLVGPGPSSRFVRQLRFRSAAEVAERRALAVRLVEQAVALERDGGDVEAGDAAEPVPAELERRLAADPELLRAWEALTPGRRRSHVLHIGGAKQSATRDKRVARCVPAIVAGRGFNER
jgi:uncharacterized protein YdeI (YjbR/CyaY-like superfamily)